LLPSNLWLGLRGRRRRRRAAAKTGRTVHPCERVEAAELQAGGEARVGVCDVGAGGGESGRGSAA
jgi:hypothetical protein